MDDVAAARTVDEVTAKQRPPIPKFPLVGAIIGLALLVIGGVMYVVPQQEGDAAEPDDYVQIAARANEFATQDNIYDATNPDEYQQRLSSLVTNDFLTEHIAAIPFAELAEVKETSSNPTVKAVAIRDADDDSAEALVAVDATITSDALEEPALYQMRWVVSLQKVSGQWLVSAMKSVSAETVMSDSAVGEAE